MSLTTRAGTITFPTWVACGFGLGFAPLAPGTIATLAFGLLYCCLPAILGIPAVSVPAGAIGAAVLIGLGVPLCTAAEKQLGHDAGPIVWDEFAGFAVAVLALPMQGLTIAGAIVLFRLFDILKPWPVNRLQNLKRGWGVVFDDVAAGIYTNLVLQGLLLLLA